MGAFAVALLLAGYWSVLGLAFLTLFGGRVSPLRRLLFAPPVGMAVFVILLFTFSRAGWPIASFAPGLAALLFGIATAILLITRPRIPWKAYAPFAGIVLLALFLSGRPHFEFGFDWVSYCNDDMSNYCLGAQRFLHHGLFDLPTAELGAGKDYSETYYYLHGDSFARPGSELVLAAVASVIGLSLPQLFMPVILSFHAALISAAAGMIYRCRATRTAALAAGILLAFSALTSFGVLYQLIAQVAGLAMLATTVTVLASIPRRLGLLASVRTSLLLAVLTLGNLLFYSEIVPFLAVAFVLLVALGVFRRKVELRTVVPICLLAIVLVLAFYNTCLPKLAWYMNYQLGGNKSVEDRRPFADAFPFYLMPSGAANLFGVLRLSYFPAEPWLSLAVAVGGVLLAAGVAATLWLTRRRQPFAVVAFVMFGVAVLMFWRRDGFALFKLAMFVQPFLLGTLAVAWVRLVGRTPARVAPLLLLAVLGLPAQRSYLAASRGVGHLFAELPDASRLGIARQLHHLIDERKPPRVSVQTDSMTLAKLAALQARGTPTFFMSEDFFYLQHYCPQGDLPPGVVRRGAGVFDPFDLHDPSQPGATNLVSRHAPDGGSEDDLFVTAATGRTIFNRRGNPLQSAGVFAYSRAGDLHNHLVYVSSDLGQPYFRSGTDLSRVAFWQVEPQPRVPGAQMVAVGRHIAFRVFGAAPSFRVLVDMTVSYKGDGEVLLPSAQVVGADRTPLNFVGRGAGRVVSEPIRPQRINGRDYVVLDFGQDPGRLQHGRTGLMKLAGADIHLDRRYLCGWVREVSLLSEEDYRKLAPPGQVHCTAAELLNPEVEFSGVTEDGWVSQEAYFCLGQESPHSAIAVRGLVPKLPGKAPLRTSLTVRVDGQEVGTAELGPGDFTVRFPTPSGPGRRRVELRFSETQRLPAPDKRPMAARLSEVGFEGVSAEP